VTRDDLPYRFPPRVFAIAVELDTVRAACRAMGIPSSTYCRWKWRLDRYEPEFLAQNPCRNVPLPRIEREEMRFLIPEIVDLAEAIHPRYRHWCSLAPTAACGSGSWPGSAKAGRSAGRGGHRGRHPHRVKGKLIAGPPKTRAGRRTVGLPPFVVRDLEAHLAAAQRPGSHIFTATGGAHLGQLHPGPLRPPDDALAAREGRYHPVRGLELWSRQHGRKPQDARSPG
jgi:hypothetical protein